MDGKLLHHRSACLNDRRSVHSPRPCELTAPLRDRRIAANVGDPDWMRFISLSEYLLNDVATDSCEPLVRTLIKVRESGMIKS